MSAYADARNGSNAAGRLSPCPTRSPLRPVTRAPCPEAAEGSTAPRVEPDQEPGTEGPNIIIRIDNP